MSLVSKESLKGNAHISLVGVAGFTSGFFSRIFGTPVGYSSLGAYEAILALGCMES